MIPRKEKAHRTQQRSTGQKPKPISTKDTNPFSDPVQEILSRLHGVKKSGKNQWQAFCPVHENPPDGHKPSLSVEREDNGKVLLYCQACGKEATPEIVKTIGLTMADLFPACTDSGGRRTDKPTPKPPKPTTTRDGRIAEKKTKPKGEIVEMYNYRDKADVVQYQSVRLNPKGFFQRRPDGKGGWINSLGDTPRILYRLPELLTADPLAWVFIVEGEKDADNLARIGLVATTNAGGAGKWHMLSDDSPLHGRRVVILPDNDDSGRKHAVQVAKALHGKAAEVRIVELPDLPDKGDVSDWLDALDCKEPEDLAEALIELTEAAPPWTLGTCNVAVSDEWPYPQPLPNELPSVKPFDGALLPETLRPWLIDIAERMECPPDYPAVGAMIALAGLVGRKIGIRPKQFDDWLVIPNLWGMLIGRPSALKSPPLREALKPLNRLVAQAGEQHRKELSAHEQEEELTKLRKSALKLEIKKAMRQGEDYSEMSNELLALGESDKPIRTRYLVNDTTVESLGAILAENPNGVVAMRDELIGLLKYLERDGQESARAFYLEGWNGNGRHETDRIGRGNVQIQAVCLSLIGTIQPGPLGDYLRGAMQGGTGNDGFIQRFQLVIWPDAPLPFHNVDRLPNKDARDMAFAVFEYLDALAAAVVGAGHDQFDPDGVPFLRFSAEAQEQFNAWRIDHENRLRQGNDHPAIEDHLTKYRSLIPSLALLIHLAQKDTGPVSLVALEKAVAWGEYLESHARRIYVPAIDPALGPAKALAKRIIDGDLSDGFPLRDVYRKHWSRLSTKEEALDAVSCLADLDWLAEEIQPTTGRTKTVYWINPKVQYGENQKSFIGSSDKSDKSPPDRPSGTFDTPDIGPQ